MRSIESESAEAGFMSIFDCERKARLQMFNDKHVDIIIDVFSTDTCQFMILKQKSNAKMSLTSVVDKYHRAGTVSGLRLLNFACSTLGSLCAALARYEKQEVVHRQINRDSIKFRFSECQ